MVLSTEAAAARLAARIKSSASGAPMLRAAIVASNPMPGESTGTVGVYLEGGTVAVPAMGGPGVAVGDAVVVWTGAPLVCLPIAGYGPYAVAQGWGTVTMTSGAASGTVTYPAGRFTVTPHPVLWSAGSVPIHGQVSAYNGTTGFDFSLTQISGSPYSGTREFSWLAIQMRSDAAVG